MPPLSLPVLPLAQTGPQLVALLPSGTAGALLFFALWLLASAAFVLFFHRVLHARAKASANRVDDIVADAVRAPLALWLVLAGLWFEATWFRAFPEAWDPGLRVAIPVLFALTGAYTLVRVAHGLMDYYGSTRPAFRGVQGTLEFATRLVVYAVAFMLVLDHLGVTITPILGALGIAGLAVALALQDTLSNFFAGLYISLDRPLREGDFVELDGGSLGNIKGYVVDVGWRTIRVRELSNNIFVVPNSRVASGVVKNYDLPESEMAALVQVSVAYESDLEHVERVTIEAAKAVLRETPGAVSHFEPFIRYHTFADSGIGFTVILRCRSFVDQYLLTHAFVKALHARYLKEGITIPYPQRTLHLGDGDGLKALLRAPPATAGRP